MTKNKSCSINHTESSCDKHQHNHCHCENHEHNHVHDCNSCNHTHNHQHTHNSLDSISGCGCGHEHSHTENFSKTQVILSIVSIILFVAALFIPNNPVKLGAYFLSVIFAGYDLFLTGIKQLLKFKFEENVLLLIAVITSFIIGEFPEACIVTILFKVGSFLESYAINKSKKSMESLMDIREDYATLVSDNNLTQKVAAKTVSIGDTILLRAGDKVSLDCVIIDGTSTIDSSALTGESQPAYVTTGDTLLSGSINTSGVLTCKVTNTFENSTASKIIDLVYSSSKKKGETEKFISKFARVYTPIVIIIAIVMAVFPATLGFGEFNDWIMRALIFLVASCPCALVISVPLSFFSAIGACSKIGVLVKGSKHIEKLSKVTAVAFDKTGTLTSGKLEVDKIETTHNSSEILKMIASIERYSTHPIAKTLVNHYGSEDFIDFSDAQEIAGLGITAKIVDDEYACGSKHMMDTLKINVSSDEISNIYFAKNNQVIAQVFLKETVNNDSLNIVTNLNKCGVKEIAMLTGDNNQSAKKVADLCNIKKYYSQLLPQDKVEKVQELKQHYCTLFVGDGINDAPVLASADVSVSMGFGSEVANSTSDIILVDNKLSFIPKAISLAKRSMNIINFNIWFALVVKFVILLIGFLGYGSMWLAVFADIGVTIISVINSVRILKVKNKQ